MCLCAVACEVVLDFAGEVRVVEQLVEQSQQDGAFIDVLP